MSAPSLTRNLAVAAAPAPGALDEPAPPVDQERLARAVREMLHAIGEDPDREGLVDTPARVARAFVELCAGLREDPAVHLGRVFQEGVEDVVVVRDVELHSLCEHHLLPFTGRAHIAYLPAGGRVVGLSKLARTVDVFARRPQVQERLTAQIADAIAKHLAPRAVAVRIESEHFCMRMRGAKKSGASMVTVAWRGEWKHDAAARAEITELLKD